MPESLLSPPSAEVLDLFAVPGPAQPLTGGSGGSWRAGDLVLSPGRDPSTQDWLSPVLARLAVALDERPGRRARDVRIAVPVPARNGSWVVEGWAATRFEPGSTSCREVAVLVATGRLLHAEIGAALTVRPSGLDLRTDRWARAERAAFGHDGEQRSSEAAALLDDVRRALAETSEPYLGPDQLVHADLARNVLLDAQGAPVVIDFSPAWRPALWAEAILVLDSMLGLGADRVALADWTRGRERVAMLRAIAFRALSDPGGGAADYRGVLRILTA